MLKIYGTNAYEYVEMKLGFVEDFSQGKIKVRIKETKGSDLRVASITYKLNGHPTLTHIETEEHRSVQKCIDELADKVTAKIARDQNKYESRKRKRRLKLQKEQERLLQEEQEAALEAELLQVVE